MKSFDELCRYVIEQRDIRLERERKRRRRIFAAVPSLAAVGAAAVMLSVGLLDRTDPAKTDDMTAPSASVSTAATTAVTAAVTSDAHTQTSAVTKAASVTSKAAAASETEYGKEAVRESENGCEDENAVTQPVYESADTAKTVTSAVTKAPERDTEVSVTTKKKPADISKVLPSFSENGKKYSLSVKNAGPDSLEIGEMLYSVSSAGGEEAQVYSIGNISDEYIVAVKIFGLESYSIFENEDYHAESFSQFRSDLDLGGNLEVYGAYSGGGTVYNADTPALTQTILNCDGEAAQGGCSEGILLDCKVKAFGRNGGIIVTKDGYLTAYFSHIKRTFFVGEDIYAQLEEAMH